MKTYLVTGGYGFIGSYVIEGLLNDSEAVVICVDNMGIGSNPTNLPESDRLHSYFKDISKKDFPDKFRNYLRLRNINHIDYIIHLAAESHVDRSINTPAPFIKNNVMATVNILDICREYDARMVNVSTDEVYGHLDVDDDPFVESSPLDPRSPYSASKAASDLIVNSYVSTFGINASTTRCCNNYGPRQHVEKLIPTIITCLKRGKQVPVYGTGLNIREWIYARDHARAVINVLYAGAPGEVYNIPGTYVATNLDIIAEVIEVVGRLRPSIIEQFTSTADCIKFVEDRKGHDLRYELSTEQNLLKEVFSHQQPFDLEKTVKFYLNKKEQ